MKRIIKWIALLCAVCLAALSLTACQNGPAVKLVVGTNSEFPPFEYLENGEVVGIDMDIMKAIADKLGMELVISDMEFDALPTALATGQIDCIAAGFSADPTREETMDFSDSYYEASQSVLVPADSAIAAAADLNGKRLGAQSGTTGEQLATDTLTGADVKGYRSAMIAVQDMMNGNLDAVVVDSSPAQVIKDQYGNDVKLIEGLFEKEEYVIAVNKGNSDLLQKINGALRTVMEDGTFENIVKKYVAAD